MQRHPTLPSGLRKAAAGALFAVLAGLTPSSAAADDVRPVQIQLREREPGLFLVRWQVPQILERAAMPRPRLPDGCVAEGELSTLEQPGSWDNRQTFRCAQSPAGQELRVEFPLGNPSLSTVIRVRFLSGERFATMLPPGESSWTVPAPPRIDAALQAVQRGTLAGIHHLAEHAVHLALLLAIVALGDLGLAVRFGAGQFLAALVVGAGISFDPRLGEVLLAAGAVVLANAAVRPGATTDSLRAVALLTGASHGLGWLSTGSGVGPALLSAIGMDAGVVLVAGVAIAARQHLGRLPALGYAAGVLAVAFGLVAWASPPIGNGASVLDASRLPSAESTGSGAAASQRVAPQAADAPVQSFVAVGAFEVRNEILLRTRDLTAALGLEAGAEIPPSDQSELRDLAATLIREAQTLTVDGVEVPAAIDRVDFMVVEEQGVLPRQVPVTETVEDAYLGVTLSTLTPLTPQEVTWTWTDFSLAAEIPVTLTDPEISRVGTLTPDSSSLRWDNQLSEDPVPTVDAVRVEPFRVAVPLLSMAILAAVAVVTWRRRPTGTAQGAAIRVGLVAALLIAPLGDVAVSLPFARSPGEGQARRVLAGVLPNIYRALEFRDETAAYDRLEISITGDALSDIYLEHRRALEMEERGGARARVEAVEVLSATDVAAIDGGFEADAVWTVAGTVTHFGHRHFRQNRYEARIAVLESSESWKIRSIEILDERRLQ